MSNRREFLGLLGASGAAAWLPAWAPLLPAAVRQDGRVAPQQQAAADVVIALRAVPAEVAILPGAPTRVWRYEAEVLSGDPWHVVDMPASYLGPTIRAHRGQRVRIRLTNELEEDTIVHWHGLHVPPEADGHPRFAIGRGESYEYDFEVTNPAGTYWYHPHPHRRTGPQVNMGLAGLFLVSDDQEAARGLPTGDHDVSLVIQDRVFDASNQLVYRAGMMGPGMMGGMEGFLGDQILVNGRPDAQLSVAPRPYRLRLLNGSNARIYKLAWDDGAPLTVLGTDGGLLGAPVRRDYITLGPGERVELLEDFGTFADQRERVLRSLGFAGGGNSGPRMGMPNGAPFDVLRVRIAADGPTHDIYVPYAGTASGAAAVSAVEGGMRRTGLYGESWASDAPAQIVRTIELSGEMVAGMPGSGGSMRWTLNGRTFEMDGVAPEDVVALGATEEWDLVNTGMRNMAGSGGGMPHPIHIHGVSFQVVERQVDGGFAEPWQSLRDGFVDDGWKDTVLVMPGERVRVRMTFRDHAGLYLYHCHNLEHEDMGMMRNYRVESQ